MSCLVSFEVFYDAHDSVTNENQQKVSIESGNQLSADGSSQVQMKKKRSRPSISKRNNELELGAVTLLLTQTITTHKQTSR